MKNRNNNAQRIRSNSQEVTESSRDELVKGLEENKGSNDFDKEIVIPSPEEHSSDLNNVKEKEMSMNYNHDQDSGTCSDFSNEERQKVPKKLGSLPELVEKANQDLQTNGEISPITKALSQEETYNGDSNEEQEKLQMSVSHKRMMSEETFASTEYVDPCSEFSSTIIGDSCRSLTAIRGYHHAYDGSISSFDAPADHFYNWESSRKQHSGKDEQKFGLPSQRLGKSKLVSNETLGTSRSRFRGRHGTACGRNNELPPMVPVYKRETGSIYGDEGSSDQTGDNFFPHPSCYHLSQSPEEFVEEEDKMRLLQIVYELEDQLKKSCILKQIYGKKNRAAYNSYELPEEEGLMDLNFPRHNPWGRNFGSLRIPFSSETTRSAHPPDYSLWGQLPRARQRSEPLPPPLFHNKSICRTWRRNFYGPYSSWPSSPQQYRGSEFSMRSSDLNELQKPRKYYREKEDHLLKRHLRPMGGAAPFMICYHCSEVLQLPEDSFIFRRRCHQVRCGTCMMVLKFSLENGTCIVPYEPDTRVPPPSEAGEYDNSIDAMNNLYSTSDVGEINEGTYSPIDPRDMRSSPLHQLMGYSSVSQVFKR